MNTTQAYVETFGKLSASNVNLQFVSRYEHVKASAWNAGGTFGGKSPSGRVTTICDRCGTDIMNVYVFVAPGGIEMHVGIDCAGKMGIPLDELKKARTFKRDAARKAEWDKRLAEIIDQKQRQLAANADYVEEINGLLSAEYLSFFEQEFLTRQLRDAEVSDISWINAESAEAAGRDAHDWKIFQSIRDRQDLIAINAILPDLPPGERIKNLKIKIWRSPVRIESQAWGTSYINFLTDSATGRSFIYKGGKRLGDYGAELVLSGTVKEMKTYDGLTSCYLQRPTVKAAG